jgi:hypothetical protein
MTRPCTRIRRLCYLPNKNTRWIDTPFLKKQQIRVARRHIFIPKAQVWVYIHMLEGIAMENVGICSIWPTGTFYGHLVYFVTLRYIFGHLAYLSRFGMLYLETSGTPDPDMKIIWMVKQISRIYQGSQMVCFQTKNSNLGKFWRVLQWKMLVYLWTLGPFYSLLLYFIDIV